MASTATSQGYGVPSRPSNLPLPQKVTFPIDFKKLMCTVVIHLFLICSIYQKYFFLSAVLSALVFSLFISFFMGYNLSNQLTTSVTVHSISPLPFCWGGERFTVQTLMWSLEFVIQIILLHDTIAELTCVCRLF